MPLSIYETVPNTTTLPANISSSAPISHRPSIPRLMTYKKASCVCGVLRGEGPFASVVSLRW